eukprot:TRINITY_DN5105_c0_g1_i1.p1 TRINITY_DN5105_c0_g1~~TRINITY_DN5105_c0_g1_i1.p1  ORF type:complete len:205 (+),score=29.21 TRINITY_DN5105_c0_g1_i1:214-828(+)
MSLKKPIDYYGFIADIGEIVRKFDEQTRQKYFKACGEFEAFLAKEDNARNYHTDTDWMIKQAEYVGTDVQKLAEKFYAATFLITPSITAEQEAGRKVEHIVAEVAALDRKRFGPNSTLPSPPQPQQPLAPFTPSHVEPEFDVRPFVGKVYKCDDQYFRVEGAKTAFNKDSSSVETNILITFTGQDQQEISVKEFRHWSGTQSSA